MNAAAMMVKKVVRRFVIFLVSLQKSLMGAATQYTCEETIGGSTGLFQSLHPGMARDETLYAKQGAQTLCRKLMVGKGLINKEKVRVK